jgi:hypothetical protein
MQTGALREAKDRMVLLVSWDVLGVELRCIMDFG